MTSARRETLNGLLIAAGIVSAGNGLGILALSPLSRWLIDLFDWRTALLLLGDLAWLIVIPAGVLLRPPPDHSTGANSFKPQGST